MSYLFRGPFLTHKGTRDNPLIDVYRCGECGTKFLSMEDKNDYENGFMYETNNLSNLDIEERLRRFQEDDVRRFDMVKNICAGKKVLDFGCGFGGFLQRISTVAEVCYGIDLGTDERNYLNSKGIKCYKYIEEIKGKFDVITLFHVFEHLSNPKDWLDKFSEYLDEGGTLILEIPHADDVLLSLYESSCFANFTYWSAHLFLYTDKSISMVIEENGKYWIESAKQIQRYTIANHLMWLAKGLPGGHKEWDFLDSKELNEAYYKKLRELKMCDTLFYTLKLK